MVSIDTSDSCSLMCNGAMYASIRLAVILVCMLCSVSPLFCSFRLRRFRVMSRLSALNTFTESVVFMLVMFRWFMSNTSVTGSLSTS